MAGGRGWGEGAHRCNTPTSYRRTPRPSGGQARRPRAGRASPPLPPLPSQPPRCPRVPCRAQQTRKLGGKEGKGDRPGQRRRKGNEAGAGARSAGGGGGMRRRLTPRQPLVVVHCPRPYPPTPTLSRNQIETSKNKTHACDCKILNRLPARESRVTPSGWHPHIRQGCSLSSAQRLADSRHPRHARTRAIGVRSAYGIRSAYEI